MTRVGKLVNVSSSQNLEVEMLLKNKRYYFILATATKNRKLDSSIFTTAIHYYRPNHIECS